MSFAKSYLAMVSDSPGRYHFLVRKGTGDWYLTPQGAAFLGLPRETPARDAGAVFREKLKSAGAGPARLEAERLLKEEGGAASLPLWLQTGKGREELIFLSLETLTDPDTGEKYLAGCLTPSLPELSFEPVTGLPGKAKLLSDLAARWQQGL
ncbi:MAG: hypothetical protein ACI4OJ_02285, partial [Lachnospiraceae bacterium]